LQTCLPRSIIQPIKLLCWAVSSCKNDGPHLARVHRTLGILRTSQAFFYALSFFWLDGFAVPAPAPVTPAVETVEKVTFQK
ncbi:MAG: hypothetical protein L6461_07360, partial [Anaerolineae bacterium]|nr:hypothetical protein [Anaerolineae bacterium]